MKNIISIFFLMISTTLFSQSNYFYYYKNQKNYLTIDKTKINVTVQNNFNPLDLNTYGLKNIDLSSLLTSGNNITLEFLSNPSGVEYIQKYNGIKNLTTINTINPNFITTNGERVAISANFNVKLKKVEDIAKLRQVATIKNLSSIEQNQFMPLWYSIKVDKTSLQNSLDLANYFYETGYFEASEPDFIDYNMFDELVYSENSNQQLPQNICVNDINFNQQWSLDNTGQIDSSTNLPGIAGTDIKACDAWQISTGANIKVAVFDTGIDYTLNDLSDNILPLNYDIFLNGPSTQYTFHGTNVAYIIAGIRNNNLYGSGVAPDSKILDVKSTNYQGSTDPTDQNYSANSWIANGFNWAWLNGADVINCSFRKNYSSIIEDAILNAITNGRNGLGTIVIASSGNINSTYPDSQVEFPANISDVISVGAINSRGQRSSNSKFGINLDVVAPADNVPALSQYNGNYNFLPLGGTSTAAPHVSGIAALVLSVNPCLTSFQVRNIIESTCQKVSNYSYATNSIRPNGTWNNEMGYGLVNAHAAVLMAQQMVSTNLDLYIKDNVADYGFEPNVSTGIVSDSPDIWIRNQIDTVQENQTPIFGIPNYIYVKVRNRGCVATSSTGSSTENLSLFLSKVSVSNPDPEYRIAYSPIESYNYDLLESQTIPVIQPNNDHIFQFTWNPPSTWTPCCGSLISGVKLLAKIITPNDPMAVPETTNVYNNVVQNNNIAEKSNISIISSGLSNGNYIEKIMVFNPLNEPRSYRLELKKDENEIGKPIYNEAEVSINMDEILYNAWLQGGKKIEKTIETTDIKRQLVIDNYVLVDNIELDAYEKGSVKVDFNFLIA